MVNEERLVNASNDSGNCGVIAGSRLAGADILEVEGHAVRDPSASDQRTGI